MASLPPWLSIKQEDCQVEKIREKRRRRREPKAMEFTTKLSSFFLVLILSIISSSAETIACGSCPSTKPKHGPKGGPILPPIIGKPPITLPPVITPILPPVVTPILPPVITPILPPVVTPILPPVVTPVLPPVTGKPSKTKPGCPTPVTPAPVAKCPINAVKLGVCLKVLSIPIHVGDPTVECCPILEGLLATEAALCLCTAIKLNLLGINISLPVALELLVSCGKTPPPGYKCP